MKIAEYKRGKKLENLFETIRGEGESQPQRIDFEIINPRDRATLRHLRLAEVKIKSLTITKLYLTGDVTSWNDSKRSEESERVKHNVFA